MIKLKHILSEITDYNFSFAKLLKDNKNHMKVKSVLAKAGIRGLDVKGPMRQTAALQNNPNFKGIMFKHMQYRYIKGKDGKTYFIYETQHWLSDAHNMPKINITEIQVSEAPKYPESTSSRDEKMIGSALVFTDKFLNAVKSVETLKRG